MTRLSRLVLAAAAVALLSGCSTFNSLTGQTDNTVLPGKREDAIPGRASFPEKQDVAVGTPGQASAPAGTTAPCKAGDPACKPPSTTGDTFKDPQ